MIREIFCYHWTLTTIFFLPKGFEKTLVQFLKAVYATLARLTVGHMSTTC